MKSKHSSVMILALLIITGVLAHEVMNKMTRTAVSAQAIAPQLAIATNGAKSANNDGPLAVFIGDMTQGSDEGGVGATNWTSLLAAEVRKVAPFRMAVDNNGEGSGYAIRATSPTFDEDVRRLVTSDTRRVVIPGRQAVAAAGPNHIASSARFVTRQRQPTRTSSIPSRTTGSPTENSD